MLRPLLPSTTLPLLREGDSAGPEAQAELSRAPVEPATILLPSTRERRSGIEESVSSIKDWWTQKLKISTGDVISELSIQEDGKSAWNGVIVDRPVGTRTLYLHGDVRTYITKILAMLTTS